MSELLAHGLEVTLVDPKRKGLGHPMWMISLGGGEVRHGDLRIEVRPAVDMSTHGYGRSYDEVERLAASAERGGGFARVGDSVHIGTEILVGCDVVEFLTRMWRRADERGTGNQEGLDAAYRQGFEDCRREARGALDRLGATRAAEPS